MQVTGSDLTKLGGNWQVGFEINTIVKENTRTKINTNVKENTMTETDTNVKENTMTKKDTNIKENTMTKTNTNVKEKTRTRTKTNTRTGRGTWRASALVLKTGKERETEKERTKSNKYVLDQLYEIYLYICYMIENLHLKLKVFSVRCREYQWQCLGTR